MTDGSTIIRQRQCAIRREIDRRGIALKQVQFDSGIPYASLLSYFPQEGSREPAVLPVSALYKLAEGRALPDDLLSLLLPTGKAIVTLPAEIDHDEVARWTETFTARKLAAHRADSPMGPEIAPCEDEDLRGIIVAFPAAAAV